MIMGIQWYAIPNTMTAQAIAEQSLSVFLAFLLAFLLTKSYNGMLRYSGFRDILRISGACLLAMVFLFVGKFIVTQVRIEALSFFPSYYKVFAITFMAMLMLTISRLVIRRIYNEYFRKTTKTVNVIIYGAGDAGPITQNALAQDTSCQYNIISFVDDAKQKIGKSINGTLVRSAAEVLNHEFINKYGVTTMIIAIPSLTRAQQQGIINKGLDLGLNVKSVPHVSTWIDNSLTSNQIEDIKIEDLLGRDAIILGHEDVRKELEGKVVMVTGAAGSIGSEICRQVLHYNPARLVMVDQAESPIYDLQFELCRKEPFASMSIPVDFVVANVKDKARMEELFAEYHPQLVYHAAAYKHVPLMEQFPYEAVLVNVFGTKNVADLAVKYKAEKFVMISTDKAVNPTNVMGATKRMAEIYTQSRHVNGTKFITTRFGNVLGSNGSVIPLFKKQLAQGGPLTVTDENIIRYFMTIPEACSLVLKASAMGEDGNIFVFDMGKPVRIYDLAQKMIKLSGMTDVQIEITGLRPGEKLYEELLATKENTIPTNIPQIMRAKVREYDSETVDKQLEELREALSSLDDFAIVAKMKEIIPEYVSNNSEFSVLDK
jgi:FlaA1/EpsC-like NDP-sugar epimerase